jgi:hypothetical protein
MNLEDDIDMGLGEREMDLDTQHVSPNSGKPIS